MSEAERCVAQLNIQLCVCALRSVAQVKSKRSANVPLTLTGKPNPTQIHRNSAGSRAELESCSAGTDHRKT